MCHYATHCKRKHFPQFFSVNCVEAFITKEIKDGAHGKHNIECDILSLICLTFVFVLRLGYSLLHLFVFVQVGDEELGIALMWAASAGKVGDHIITIIVA